ncbi:hypothetical protein [Streptomyces bugieae]|uniref:DUF4280 domain-containing protein n=1 Tax=Streptomyces bugieae TaxID=3098223 RepID=A0ABU7NP86_9ACTN|nr:hypothetical protein [Streptomyces sp. DSM 41528]
MSFVLTEGAVLQCSHGGRTSLTTGNPTVTVKGHGVVTAGAEVGFQFGAADRPVPGMIAPCPVRTPDGSSPLPCTIAAPTTPAGTAKKLMVGGTPVLLDTASGVTVSSPAPGTWSVADPGQTILEAI